MEFKDGFGPASLGVSRQSFFSVFTTKLKSFYMVLPEDVVQHASDFSIDFILNVFLLEPA